MNNARILVIDDEVQIRRLLEITLESHDLLVFHAATAKEGLIAASAHPPDMIILDLGLPDIPGHEVLKALREWYNRPIPILSVQSNEHDIISALDNGANDYLIKPFRTGELLARIRAALRSTVGESADPVIDCGNIQINLSQRAVKLGNDPVKLTGTEYALLSLFAKNEGRVLTQTIRTQWVKARNGETFTTNHRSENYTKHGRTNHKTPPFACIVHWFASTFLLFYTTELGISKNNMHANALALLLH